MPGLDERPGSWEAMLSCSTQSTGSGLIAAVTPVSHRLRWRDWRLGLEGRRSRVSKLLWAGSQTECIDADLGLTRKLGY